MDEQPNKEKKKKIAFIHLDLGIGGAERLVVNAAISLKNIGNDVIIYTSHHDPSHCFPETTGDGPLSGQVLVYGDWLPRQVLGRATVACAVLRMWYLSLVLLVHLLFGKLCLDAIMCDGVAACVPLLQLGAPPVLFYCHFPDKLLCTERESFFKRLYRLPFDLLEDMTTACSSKICVNSQFTAGVFQEAFPLSRRLHPQADLAVLYPAIPLAPLRTPATEIRAKDLKQGKLGPIVSINRYERKKNIQLAIEALAVMKQNLSEMEFQKLQLVIAGGYDPAVQENVEYFEELKNVAKKHCLEGKVIFKINVSDEERTTLLESALCTVYTPDKEHFGIVPIEAMYFGSPVVAVASGGPLESVDHPATGFLCEVTAESFGQAMLRLVKDPQLSVTMGKAGHTRVIENFSLEAFGSSLQSLILEFEKAKNQTQKFKNVIRFSAFLGALFGIFIAFFLVLFLYDLVASANFLKVSHQH